MNFEEWYTTFLKREIGSYDPVKASAEATHRQCWAAAQAAPHAKVIIRAGLTEEGMQRCQAMREQYIAWTDIAKELCVNESTLRRAWKKSGRTVKFELMSEIHALYLQRMPWKVIASYIGMNERTAQERYYKWAKEQKENK